jgi:hypothetical protein
LIGVMRQSGWAPYATESVFRATRLTRSAEAQASIRRQEPADTWAVHQLYAATVPRHVQEIEAITSHVWHLDPKQRQRWGAKESGWLLMDGGQLTGYVRYKAGPHAAMIDAVVAPGMGTHLGSLLDSVAAVHARSGKRSVYFALRGYHADLKAELLARGFIEIGDQDLLIRYTTATARAPTLEPVHFPVELRPAAVPQRVPTFLETQPTDGAI